MDTLQLTSALRKLADELEGRAFSIQTTPRSRIGDAHALATTSLAAVFRMAAAKRDLQAWWGSTLAKRGPVETSRRGDDAPVDGGGVIKELERGSDTAVERTCVALNPGSSRG